jgi:hypothetical protein
MYSVTPAELLNPTTFFPASSKLVNSAAGLLAFKTRLLNSSFNLHKVHNIQPVKFQVGPCLKGLGHQMNISLKAYNI